MQLLVRIVMSITVLMLLAACSASATNDTAPSEHDGHDMATTGDQPYDLLFLDSMIVHHQGAIDMAQDALANAEHSELKSFAQNVIMQQDGEITQMKVWRGKWYPDATETSGLGMHMGDMTIGTDTTISYDIRWIDAMISHHEGAIDMANDALKKSQNPDIINLCNAIIQAQSTEIAQLKAWRAQW
jgi:uncharacterized protein (DUF305 family)